MVGKAEELAAAAAPGLGPMARWPIGPATSQAAGRITVPGGIKRGASSVHGPQDLHILLGIHLFKDTPQDGTVGALKGVGAIVVDDQEAA